jgi:hypothetical protein
MKKIILYLVFPLLFISTELYAQEKYNLEAKKIVLNQSREIGLQQVGITEKSNHNDGLVVKYLTPFGLPEGNPYCAAGIYWTFLIAVQNLQLSTNDIPIPKTPLANQIFNYAKNKGKKVKLSPKINDLIIWRKSNTPFGHIERIITIEDRHWVTTLAFNIKSEITGKEGVYLKKRNILHPLGRLSIRGLVGFQEL